MVLTETILKFSKAFLEGIAVAIAEKNNADKFKKSPSKSKVNYFTMYLGADFIENGMYSAFFKRTNYLTFIKIKSLSWRKLTF